jgi:hypothetical protein
MGNPRGTDDIKPIAQYGPAAELCSKGNGKGRGKGKDKSHHRTGHKGPERE